jgi:hypothetical protein
LPFSIWENDDFAHILDDPGALGAFRPTDGLILMLERAMFQAARLDYWMDLEGTKTKTPDVLNRNYLTFILIFKSLKLFPHILSDFVVTTIFGYDLYKPRQESVCRLLASSRSEVMCWQSLP